MPFDKTCHNCGSYDNYRTEMKNNQKTAWCNDCDSFIGNEPYQKPMFYFGKYKEKPIEDFETPDEINYLLWIKNKTDIWDKLRPAVQEAIERKID